MWPLPEIPDEIVNDKKSKDNVNGEKCNTEIPQYTTRRHLDTKRSMLAINSIFFPVSVSSTDQDMP